MGYRHIENLYKNREILMFKQAIAMEKIHGTSCHITYKIQEDGTDSLVFFSGGMKYDTFRAIFNYDKLLEQFRLNAKNHSLVKEIIIWGEGYGGNMQKMSETYGPDPKFVAFEVSINGEFLGVFSAEKIVGFLGLEFVHYRLINATEEEINAERDADSVQAIRNGMGQGHMREGIVLRPVVELIHPNGGRIICKHKRAEFAEQAHPPKRLEEKTQVLIEAQAIAEEWVVPERLRHVLDKIQEPSMEKMKEIISAMIEDVYREASGEIKQSSDVSKAISKKTVELFKRHLQENIYEKN